MCGISRANRFCLLTPILLILGAVAGQAHADLCGPEAQTEQSPAPDQNDPAPTHAPSHTTDGPRTETGTPTSMPARTANGEQRQTIRLETTTQPTSTTSGPTPAQPENRPCRRQTEELGATATPLEEARAHLAVAHCLLVTECAPPLSAICLGLARPDQTLPRNTAAGLIFLDRAAAALDRAGDDVDAGVAMLMEDRIDLLGAFAEMFVALGGTSTSPGPSKPLREACNDLAIYLDDEDPKIVESARLYLGVAYRLAGRPERTLQLIRPTLDTPADPRVGLLARLQRCLALGKRGDYVAGRALCLRIGARVEKWFAGEDRATQRRATDTVRFIHAELSSGWAAKLRETDQDDLADEVEAQALKLFAPSDSPPLPGTMLGLVESIAGLQDLEIDHPPSPEQVPAYSPDRDEVRVRAFSPSRFRRDSSSSLTRKSSITAPS